MPYCTSKNIEIARGKAVKMLVMEKNHIVYVKINIYAKPKITITKTSRGGGGLIEN